jgi:hypothetical protein
MKPYQICLVLFIIVLFFFSGDPITYTDWYPGQPDNNANNGESFKDIQV